MCLCACLMRPSRSYYFILWCSAVETGFVLPGCCSFFCSGCFKERLEMLLNIWFLHPVIKNMIEFKIAYFLSDKFYLTCLWVKMQLS